MESNNSRIAKNAVLLYGRMFISMAIGFYTSRVVLQALGVSDFGIYNLVGGIVVMMGMINGALNSATTRFLTFGLGLKDDARLKVTFSTAFITHVALSLIFLVLAETIGLWIVNTQLIIPADRMIAANWAYQSAIISTALGITQVPYNASITSHERFGIFAALDIANSVLKLTIALFVLYSGSDHLIVYSLLYASVAIAIMLFYRIYCIGHFTECRISRNFSKPLFKEMVSFTSWNLFGNASFTLYQQGTNILLNRVFGTFINAAAGVALQVQAILYGFIGNITNAFTPQVVKCYAQKDFIRVNELIFMGARISAFLTMLISIPVMVKMDFLMGIWLKDVPEGAVVICQLLLVNNIINSLNPIAYSGIAANGKLKSVNILMGCTYMAMIFVVYFVLKITHSYEYVYALFVLMPIISGQYYYGFLKKYMPEFRRKQFNMSIVIPTLIISASGYMLCSFFNNLVDSHIWSFILVLVVSSILVSVSSMYMLFDIKTRAYFIKRIIQIVR